MSKITHIINRIGDDWHILYPDGWCMIVPVDCPDGQKLLKMLEGRDE